MTDGGGEEFGGAAILRVTANGSGNAWSRHLQLQLLAGGIQSPRQQRGGCTDRQEALGGLSRLWAFVRSLGRVGLAGALAGLFECYMGAELEKG